MTTCPASLYISRIKSLRKSFNETSEPRPLPKFQTLLAHFSNSVSWVTPRSSVMASYSVRPGDLWLLLGSPPSPKRMTSVERRGGVTLEKPATYFPSHLTRNLKFLYASNRLGLAGNIAMGADERRSVLPARILSVKPPFRAALRFRRSAPEQTRAAS